MSTAPSLLSRLNRQPPMDGFRVYAVGLTAPTPHSHAAATRAGASDEARLGSKEPPFVWMLVSATVRSQNVLAVCVAKAAHGQRF